MDADKNHMDRMENRFEDVGRYEDIILLPHHQSKKHPHMSEMNRAAQFAPFAALTGHREVLRETEENREKCSSRFLV